MMPTLTFWARSSCNFPGLFAIPFLDDGSHLRLPLRGGGSALTPLLNLDGLACV